MSKKKTQQKTRLMKKNQQINEPQCCCSRQKSSTRIRCDKNRVTIFGEVGQSENDKYTLEYAAKINNMPMSPEFSQYHNKSDDQEDSEENLKPVVSHAVQVNIHEHSGQSDRHSTAGNDQGIQCNFEKFSLVPDFHGADNHEGSNVLKKCNSPVIVISVYPRPDVKINTEKSLKKSEPNIAKKYSNNLFAVENPKIIKQRKEVIQNRRSKSRSGSPLAKEIETDNTTNNLQSQKALRPKIKISNVSHTNRKIVKSEPQNGNENYTTKLKHTLIDNFIKSMESEEDNNYAKFLLSVPKSTASRITLNLNKTKQCDFDVATNNCKKEAELKKVKNTFKDAKKPVAVKKITIKNYKVTSEKQSPKTNKLGTVDTAKKSCNSKPMQLKPRDSLVVNHSREIRRSEIREGVRKINGERKFGNTDARKHYRGDDCPIDDPNVRDKEIQRLLGLTKKRTTHLRTVSKTHRQCGLKNCSKAITLSDKKKHLSCSRFLQTNNNGQNNILLENLNVNWKEKLLEDKCLSKSPKAFNKIHSCINKVPKPNSPRADKVNKFVSNIVRNFEYSELRTNKPRLIYDYEFFHAQKPYKYRRNKLPIKRCNKITMTSKNAIVNYLASKTDTYCSLKIEKTNRIQFLPNKKIQTEIKNLEKYVQTEKNAVTKVRLKKVYDSNCKLKENFNRLLNIDSERILTDQDKKKICLRTIVSAVDASNIPKSNLKLETTKSYINQKGDGLDIKSSMQADIENSFFFIYNSKEPKRSVTPNLGTSFVSISAETFKNTHQKPHKGRKTFLLHILSYVMKKFKRSSSVLDNRHRLKKCSTPNSFDSYYVNTSLAPWDMSSLMYDTSVSYCSNHSLHSVTKIKRGFFSSVCDVLARRKRQVDKLELS